jgi:hypothetical protein
MQARVDSDFEESPEESKAAILQIESVKQQYAEAKVEAEARIEA